MKVVIVDDERLARDELRRLLASHEDVMVVAEAANVADGVRAVELMQPDLVFLDIQMPDGSGFDLLSRLDHVPAVVFTTAFEQYAIRAFDVSALDYLLKPIEPARLAASLRKYGSAGQPTPAPKSAQDAKVFIQDGERCWFVPLLKIALFESEGNYTRVYFEQNRPLLLRSLMQLEARLDPNVFIRVSRSQIVNTLFLLSIDPLPSGSLTLTLEGGLKVSMSRRRSVLFKQLNKL
jgi:two-component system LytT family response regulator